MKLGRYIKDKINFILAYIIYIIIIISYTNAMGVDKNVILVISIMPTIFFIVGFITSYIIKNRYIKDIEKTMEGLQEKYLISEIIKKPRREENLAYYKILKKANKSMIDNVSEIIYSKKEYKEYIESWVHEIKIPITSAKLLCENNKSDITNKIDEELEEINNFVEQALFYARLEQVSNDFMIRKIEIAEIIKNVLARNKKIMIQNNMKVEIRNIDVSVYTDEKWLEFILNQIIINAIKYKKEYDSKVTIEAIENKEDIKILIKDNGIGIKESEINRIFEKGFTGTNGRKLNKKSTGIGLYLCNKLCKELNIEIEAQSKENEYTQINLKIPKSKKGE